MNHSTFVHLCPAESYKQTQRYSHFGQEY